jgi:hypothetical protein
MMVAAACRGIYLTIPRLPDSPIGVILLFGELTKPHRYGDRACHGTVP